MCGEKALRWCLDSSNRGSPPRVRGKGRQPCYCKSSPGITPACAGKRESSFFRILISEDHPRVCGEKLVAHHSTYRRIGSPPRVRGKESAGDRWRRWLGITPACAGKSYTCQLEVQDGWDHPRVCGEKKLTLEGLFSIVGSPPRVRGKASRPSQYLSAYRITPACAGKSSISRWRRVPAWDHPRVCGEKTKKSP